MGPWLFTFYYMFLILCICRQFSSFTHESSPPHYSAHRTDSPYHRRSDSSSPKDHRSIMELEALRGRAAPSITHSAPLAAQLASFSLAGHEHARATRTDQSADQYDDHQDMDTANMPLNLTVSSSSPGLTTDRPSVITCTSNTFPMPSRQAAAMSCRPSTDASQPATARNGSAAKYERRDIPSCK